MSFCVYTKFYGNIAPNKKEILRYAGQGAPTEEVNVLLEECLKELSSGIAGKVCYCRVPVNIADNTCDFEHFSVNSENLAKNLQNCDEAIIFGATIGSEIDRAVLKYSAISPTKALMFQAIGADLIETVCDLFCDEISTEAGALRPRFSPGYGDLPLETQKMIFALLSCEKHIGLTLNGSLSMSPSKSVTAIVGILKK